MNKYTIKQFNTDYPDDKSCLESLFNNRYGQDCECPSCHLKGRFHLIQSRKRYDCQCGFSVYPVSGTIFHKSPTSLHDWFHAIFLFASSRNGVAAKEIERQVGVTYKCAWRMARQIRLLFSQSGEPLSGTVEIDETYVGGRGKNNKRGRGAENKTPVFGIVEREGNVKATVVENVKTRTIQPIINRSVSKNTIVITDEFGIYNSVAKNGYTHEKVQHAIKEYVRGKIHTNTIEGFWSQLKRSLDGTHHVISPKYLQTYVDEFVYRWNERHSEEPLFETMIAQVAKRV